MVRCFPEDYRQQKHRNGSIETLMGIHDPEHSSRKQNRRIEHYK
jgi:hypothetical protein